MEKMGRPVKNKHARRKVSTFIDEPILAEIDDFVAERKKTNRGYSRADFFSDAAAEYLGKRKVGGIKNG